MLSTKKDFSTPLRFARNDKSKQIIKLNKINKKMKKLSTLLIIAFALVLGLSQCKKKVDTIATPSDLGKTVHITVNVGGDKHDVFPNTGAVVYTDGDKIYVGDGSKYLGTLTYGSGAFSGDITEPAVDDYLYFYFLGGLTPSATPEAGTTTDFTVSIANQSSKLPVLSLGRSSSPYTTSSATYGCTLENKCALVKFILNSSTSTSVKVGGMKTEACIDFKTPGIIPTEKTGAITLNSESGTAKWAILLPIASETPTKVEINGWNYNVILPQIEINDYFADENAINVPYKNYTFTISAMLYGFVHFSQGNLQYKNGEGWRFAQNQYDYINEWNTSNWVDRFGFGTWGEDRDPLNTSTEDYSGYQWNTDFQGSIGGYSTWRTLTRGEWVYLFNTRTTENNINSTQNARYTKATINTDGTGVNGIILFPDQSIGATPEGVTWGTINDGASEWGTKCTTAGWNALENAGCVFLPAAGGRDGTSIFNPGSQGQYWSSSDLNYTDGYYLNFTSDMVNPEYSYRLYFGRSVRLVR